MCVFCFFFRWDCVRQGVSDPIAHTFARRTDIHRQSTRLCERWPCGSVMSCVQNARVSSRSMSDFPLRPRQAANRTRQTITRHFRFVARASAPFLESMAFHVRHLFELREEWMKEIYPHNGAYSSGSAHMHTPGCGTAHAKKERSLGREKTRPGARKP